MRRRVCFDPAPEVKSTDSVDDMDFLFLDLTEPAEAAPTPTRLSDIRRRCEQLGASDLQAFHPDHTQYGDSIDLEYILEMRSLVIDIKNRPGFYFRPMLDAVRYAIDNRPVRISVAVVLKILRAQSIGAVEICDRSRDPTAKPPSTPRPQNAPRIVRVEDMPFTLLKDGEFFVKRGIVTRVWCLNQSCSCVRLCSSRSPPRFSLVLCDFWCVVQRFWKSSLNL